MMRLLLSLLFAFSSSSVFAQTEPTPYLPVNGAKTNIKPDLRLTNPNTALFKYFQFQADTTPAFNSSIRYQSGWSMSSIHTVNYDSMIFNQTYYWRVRSVKVSGSVYDTTVWSSYFTFITGVTPRIGTTKNYTFFGPSGTVNIVHTGAKHREVEADTTPAFNSGYNIKDTIEGTANTAKYSQLRFGVKYYFRYRDFTSLSASTYSDTGTINVQAHGATFIYPNSQYFYAPKVFVLLQANTDLNQFELEVDTSAQFNSQIVTHNGLTRTGTTVQFMGNDMYLNTQYYFRTRAITPQDTSTWFTFALTTNDLPLLNAPTNNSTGVAANAALDITSPNRASARLQLDTVPGFNSGYLKDTSISHIDSSGSNYYGFKHSFGPYRFGKKYYYRARTFNSVDTSNGWRGPNNFTTIQPYSQFTFPYNAQEHVDDAILLSWNSVKGVDGYHIQLSNDSFNSITLDKYVFGQDSFFTGVSLQTNKVYYARIRLFNSVDTTVWLNSIRFKTRLPFVNKISPLDSSAVSNDSIPLVWRSTAPGFRYEIGVWTVKGFTNRILTDTVTDTVYYFHPPARGKIYFWDVKAMDGNYVHPNWYYYRDWSFVPLLAPPVLTVPSNGALNQARNSLQLKWNAVPGATGYRVQLDLDPNFSAPLTSDVAVNNAVVSGLPANSVVYWRVRAYADYYGAWSNAFSFTTTGNVSIGELRFAESEEFGFYPNPLNDFVVITIPQALQSTSTTVEIYTVNGQLLKGSEISGKEYELSTADLPEGILVYRIRSANGVQTGKLVKKISG